MLIFLYLAVSILTIPKNQFYNEILFCKSISFIF